MPEIEYGDAVYCSVSDVKKLFRKPEAFTTESNPSDNQVLKFIREATETIDDYTRTSFHENRVVDEHKTFDGDYRWGSGRPVMPVKMPIQTPFDASKGDKIEVWTGSRWEEWVSDESREEGRNGDYWVEGANGPLWLYRRFTWHSGPQVRLSYRYGESKGTSQSTLDDGTTYDVIDRPRSIKRACSKLAAVDLMASDQFTQLVPGGEGAPSPENAMDRWETQVYGSADRDGILDRYKVDPAWVEPL